MYTVNARTSKSAIDSSSPFINLYNNITNMQEGDKYMTLEYPDHK